MAEKRKYARLNQDMPARHRTQQGAVIEPAFAKNISIGGVRLRAASGLDVGTQVDVEVAINKFGAPYYMRGEVVWQQENNPAEDKKFDMGIRFIRVLSRDEHQGF